MNRKLERKVLQSLKLDGSINTASRRANVTPGAVRWLIESREDFAAARAEGLRRVEWEKAKAAQARKERLEGDIERSEERLRAARERLARDLPKLSVAEIRAEVANIETRVQEVDGYRRLLKGKK